MLEGPTLSMEEWGACLDVIGQTVAPGGFQVASGSLPPGVPADFYARAVRLAREAGAECVVPDFAAFLVEQGIDSISLNPDSLLRTIGRIAEAEAAAPPRAQPAETPKTRRTVSI